MGRILSDFYIYVLKLFYYLCAKFVEVKEKVRKNYYYVPHNTSYTLKIKDNERLHNKTGNAS